LGKTKRKGTESAVKVGPEWKRKGKTKETNLRNAERAKKKNSSVWYPPTRNGLAAEAPKPKEETPPKNKNRARASPNLVRKVKKQLRPSRGKKATKRKGVTRKSPSPS